MDTWQADGARAPRRSVAGPFRWPEAGREDSGDAADDLRHDITVLLASPRPAVQSAWMPRLTGDRGLRVGVPAMHPARLATRLAQAAPDVLLLDRALLDRLAPDAMRRLRQGCPRMRVLLVGDAPGAALVADVLRNRFHGFLLTSAPPALWRKAIRAVRAGELWLPRASMADALAALPEDALADYGTTAAPARGFEDLLTRRELQVVELLRRGCTNKEIALQLGIMEDTVKKHLQGVFAKLGVHRRTLVALRGLPATA